MSDPSTPVTNPLATVMPFILIFLGVIALLFVLFIPARILLRKRLVPIPSPRVPPSGAAPWTRTPTSSLPVPPSIQQGYSIFNAPYSAPPPAPSTNSYFGLAQSQPLIPTTPHVLPTVQAEYREKQPEQTINLATPVNPFANARQPIDSSYPGARKRLRRNALRAPGDKITVPQHNSGERSADMMVVSDPYPQTMLKQHNQTGQSVKQAPQESS